MNNIVLFIDDDDVERRSSLAVLREIFEGTPLSVSARAPFRDRSEYAELVAKGDIAAIILDQRLNTSGDVSYSGSELAAYLRSIGSRVPIVILTNYPGDDFTGEGWAVECIVQKKKTLQDPASNDATEFKLRLTRQIAICADVLAVRESRFHELLVKSSRGSLSADEERELRQLEGERVAAVVVSERERQLKLDADIEALKKLLHQD